MVRRGRVLPLAALAIATLSCEDVITETRDSTFVVEISVGGSPFVAAGDYLVGDQVQFFATVEDDGAEIVATGQRFSSSDENVVEILDAGSGLAVFRAVGDARIDVTIDEPALRGQKLKAFMDVSVTTYQVVLSLESVVTGSAVSSDDGLVDDTVRVLAEVRKNGTIVPSSGVRLQSSSELEVARQVTGRVDQVAYVGKGEATLTVTLQQPEVPGGGLLEATLDVQVDSFVVNFGLDSFRGTVPANGDTLVTDSVRFSAEVIKAGNIPVVTSGASWASSDPTVINIVDPALGLARLDDVGTAIVSVSFDDPKLPGEPFELVVPVSTLVAEVDITSRISGSLAGKDTLVTDSVIFSALVKKENEAGQRSDWVGSVGLSQTESSDPSVVQIIDSPAGWGVLVATGSATVTLTLSEPELPDGTPLVGSLPLEVSTIVAAIRQAAPDSVPAMGDAVQYDVTVTRTRDGTQISNPLVTYLSSDGSVIEMLDPATGAAFARDTGTTTVSVVVNDPSLPAGTVSATLAPTTLVHERFYGTFSQTSGEFGLTPYGDTVAVEASAVHFFTDSTRIEFPNGTVGFVDRAIADSLFFFVPAAGTSGKLVLRNLKDDAGGFRDSVETRIVFSGPGEGAVDDYYEPNDGFPLSARLEIAFPFDVLLSWDPRPAAAPDTNFFYFTVPSGQEKTLDIVAEWQTNADLDFKICNALGPLASPPTGYEEGLCPRPQENNSQDLRSESEIGQNLSTGRYVIGFYCSTVCPALPVTYKVTIVEQ